MVKLPYYRLQSLIVATEGYKYYCHFYDDYLQSVCLQTRTSKGLYGILKNTVFFWLDQPDRPLYKTEEDPIRIRKHSKEGLWSFPPNVSLPWAVDHNNITYTKVDGRDGEPGYYDVKFTPESPSKRFTKLEPISVNDMKLAEGINDISGRLRFVADVYFATIAEVNLADPPQGMLTPRWLAMDVESSASTAGLRVLNYRDITTKASTKVRTLEARSDGLFYRAKAFIFKFPLPEVQHGIMFYASNNALMLYRQDQVHLRHHDTLPSE
ncbi:hypothetical protein FOL47_010224 [Perkinsus chesapeaki]|uniref:Uncharacterized protein n=1 Tax=Perkinsus chesapeaki TaxID=330153 RepID=A0A7J6L3X5_PERCH|nr:hypothetical protein FOL47_010224 [Perkinsus chesapeaki]